MTNKNIVEKFIQNGVEFEVPSKTSDLINDNGFITDSNVLTKTNTTSFTPSGNYQPATKKYVDDAVASAGAGNMSSLVQFGRTRWRGTKAMFNALENKDVNGVYVILSEKDYQKMIND